MFERKTAGTMSLTAQIELRRAHLAFLEEESINPFPAEPPLRTATNSIIRARANELIENKKPIHSVGRVTAIRDFGKIVFARIDDGSGEGKEEKTQRGDLQIMFSPQTNPGLLRLFKGGGDLGDIISVSGPLTISKTGELTIQVDSWNMLAKALRPPPNLQRGKHSIDPDIARGKRYLELMPSHEARERFRTRSKIVQMMRERFIQLGNLEVDTPVLDIIYGGASAKPFITQQNALNQAMYLRISNELYLKKLIVGMLCAGEGGVFEFSRDFRNEGMDATHHPEFTQVELYMPYQDYYFMMEMTETLYKDIAQKIKGNLQVDYQGKTIDFNNWRKVKIYDGLRDVLGIDPQSISSTDLALLARLHNIKTDQERGSVLLELFEKVALPTYGPDPLFVLDYPKDTSPLTKIHRQDPELVERFELFIGGMEVANCYTELNDPRDQRKRFEAEVVKKAKGDEEAMLEDEDFLEAMEHGLPPMGGIGLSIDRLAMLFTNQPHIQDVILFPHRKGKKA